jgi:hypothetical protein
VFRTFSAPFFFFADCLLVPVLVVGVFLLAGMVLALGLTNQVVK